MKLLETVGNQRAFVVNRALFGTLPLLFIFMGAMPHIPDPKNLFTLGFLLLFVICMVLAIANNRFISVSSRLDLYLIGLLAYWIFVNFPVALIYDVSVAQYFRAIVPFLFLPFFWIIRKHPKATAGATYNLILIASAVWAVMIYARYFPEIVDFYSGRLFRLTAVAPEALVPFAMIGSIMALYHPQLRPLGKVLFLLVFIILLFASGYRSQLLIIAVIFVFRYRNITNPAYIIILLMTVVGLFIFAQQYPDAVMKVFIRFQVSNGDTTRANEIEYALRHFYESPVLGKGLGFPIPISETRPLISQVRFDRDEVSYLHNVIAYFAMDTGLIGLSLLVLFFGKPFLMMGKLLRNRGSNYLEAALICYAAIFVYCLISASFRQIQIVIVLCCLYHIILVESARQADD